MRFPQDSVDLHTNDVEGEAATGYLSWGFCGDVRHGQLLEGVAFGLVIIYHELEKVNRITQS
jgi:hypothetical protein